MPPSLDPQQSSAMISLKSTTSQTRAQIEQGSIIEIPDLDGKVVIVTGGSAGMFSPITDSRIIP